MKDQPNQLDEAAHATPGLRRLGRAVPPLVPTVTLMVLAAVALWQWSDGAERGPESEAPPLRLTERLPMTAGGWVGQAWEPPEPARPLLRPVRRSGRVYEDVDTGRRAAVLIVEADDRRDLGGYEPARWYPARGWQIVDEREVVWRVAGVELPAIKHALSGPGREGPDQAPLGEAGGQLFVTSFAVDARGKVAPRLEGIAPAYATATPATAALAGSAAGGSGHPAGSSNATRRRPGAGGAALVQVVLAGDAPRPVRATAVDRLIRGVILSIHQDSSAADRGGDQP